MAREVGISNITLFPLKKDDAGNLTYDDAAKFALPWAVSFETTEEYAESEYYADNIVERSAKLLSKIGLSLEVSSDTPPALDAKITGKAHKYGMSINLTGITQPTFAIAYSIMMDDGNERRRVIYKCNLARTGQTNETVADSVTAQTYTYEGSASALVYNNRFDAIMDKKEIDAMPEGNQSGNQTEQEAYKAKKAALDAWTNFFKTVQGKEVTLP
jgi:hypothetical protein